MLRKNIYEFDKNVFDEINNKWGIIVSGDRTTGVNGMTVSWGALGVLWNKDVLLLFVRKSRYTHEFMDKTNSVTISFLSDKYKKEKAIFGSKSGRDIDKFEQTGLHKALDVDFNGYYIPEADYVFKAKKLMDIDLEYDKLPDNIKEEFYKDKDIHTLYICEITQYLINEKK